jgi:hypothetical protein
VWRVNAATGCPRPADVVGGWARPTASVEGVWSEGSGGAAGARQRTAVVRWRCAGVVWTDEPYPSSSVTEPHRLCSPTVSPSPQHSTPTQDTDSALSREHALWPHMTRFPGYTCPLYPPSTHKRVCVTAPFLTVAFAFAQRCAVMVDEGSGGGAEAAGGRGVVGGGSALGSSTQHRAADGQQCTGRVVLDETHCVRIAHVRAVPCPAALRQRPFEWRRSLGTTASERPRHHMGTARLLGARTLSHPPSHFRTRFSACSRRFSASSSFRRNFD